MANGGPRVRILIAEDHAVVREGFRSLLTYDGSFEVVDAVADGIQAVESYRVHQPDVVLMDLQMPGLDGVAASQAIRTHDVEARILILTTYDGDEDVRRSLAAGALGYVLKESPPEVLVHAILTVARGDRYLSSSAMRAVESRPHHEDPLSAREVEVLRLVSKGMSNREIADELFVSEATARTHVGHILAKLEVNDRLAAVMTGVRRGILRI